MLIAKLLSPKKINIEAIKAAQRELDIKPTQTDPLAMIIDPKDWFMPLKQPTQIIVLNNEV